MHSKHIFYIPTSSSPRAFFSSNTWLLFPSSLPSRHVVSARSNRHGFVQILPPHLPHCHLIDTLHSIPCLLPFLVRSFFSLIPSLLCVIVASLLLLSLFSISRPLWWWCRTTLTRLSDSHPFPPILFTFPPFTLIAACRSFFSSSRFSFLFSFSRSILSTADCHRIPLVKSVHLPSVINMLHLLVSSVLVESFRA